MSGVTVSTAYGVESYSTPNASGYCTPQAGAKNSVQRKASGWVETQPDGTIFNYNSSGTFLSVQNPSGARVTATRDSNARVAALVSPSGRRVSYIYAAGANGFFRRFQDAAGRLTSLTFQPGPHGNLKQLVTPDSAITTLLSQAPGTDPQSEPSDRS
jgi:hypothetical protein